MGEFNSDNHYYEIPWRRKWQPTPVLLPGKFHGQRNLVNYSPRGRKELGTTERRHFMGSSGAGLAVFQRRDEPGWGGAGLAFLLCKLSLETGCDLG